MLVSERGCVNQSVSSVSEMSRFDVGVLQPLLICAFMHLCIYHVAVRKRRFACACCEGGLGFVRGAVRRRSILSLCMACRLGVSMCVTSHDGTNNMQNN